MTTNMLNWFHQQGNNPSHQGKEPQMNFDIEIVSGDQVAIDGTDLSLWATVLEVYTGGCKVRHVGGHQAVYWFSRVLDVDPRSRQRH